MIKNLFFKAPRSSLACINPQLPLGTNLVMSRAVQPYTLHMYPAQMAPTLGYMVSPFTYSQALVHGGQRSFSQYFRDLDNAALREFGLSYCGSKAYKKAVDLWKVPLEKKRLKRERKAANPPRVEPPEESGQGLAVVHFPDQGITWPPSPDQCFAVINVKG
jgi:hypothetical protein